MSFAISLIVGAFLLPSNAIIPSSSISFNASLNSNSEKENELCPNSFTFFLTSSNRELNLTPFRAVSAKSLNIFLISSVNRTYFSLEDDANPV